MPKFLHVGFNFADGNKIAELTPVFDKALDWVRYAPNCWMLWTTSSPEKWYQRLKPHLGSGEHVFIVELQMSNRQGWLPKKVWDWINKVRSEG
jgi:hypothetical protein